tara:strand:- start:949 stop:1674 length:726 start_codon:yes stop_codon:yes gene_type:complete
MPAASVATVYNTLLDLVNKDQRGMITPSIFNSFAQIAQLRVFNKMFDALVQGKTLRIRGIDPSDDKSLVRRVKEDLSNFIKTVDKTKSNGVFAKPDDFARLVSVSTKGVFAFNTSTEIPIELMYDKDKLRRLLRSTVAAPRDNYPVAMVEEDITVYPDSVNKITITYYKIPQGRNNSDARRSFQPSISFISTTGVVNDSTTVNFELPEHYTDELVFEIASMIGLNLRDADVVNYSELKDKE